MTSSSRLSRQRILLTLEEQGPFLRQPGLRHKGTADVLLMKAVGYRSGRNAFRLHLRHLHTKKLIHDEGDFDQKISLGPPPVVEKKARPAVLRRSLPGPVPVEAGLTSANPMDVPVGGWFFMEEAARRVDPWEDIVGFLEQVSVVVDEYVPKIRGWLNAHGFTAGGVLDLMAQAVDNADGWKGHLRRHYLHGLDVDTIAILLGMKPDSVEQYIEARRMNPRTQHVGKLHARGRTNANIARSLLNELGLQHNGPKWSTPQQREQILKLRSAGTTYFDIARIVGVSMDQVKNTLRNKRREGSQCGLGWQPERW